MAKFLKWCNTLRGTVRENTKKLTASEMQKGETTAQHSGQWTSLCLGMARQETLSVFSTSQQLKFRRGEGGGKEKQKSKCVIYYNQHMLGVDKKDQLLHLYLVEAKKNE